MSIWDMLYVAPYSPEVLILNFSIFELVPKDFALNNDF